MVVKKKQVQFEAPNPKPIPALSCLQMREHKISDSTFPHAPSGTQGQASKDFRVSISTI